MKYEPCNGMCYAPGDVMNMKDLNIDSDYAVNLLKDILSIHEPACENENLSYGLDYDEDLDIFISSFRNYGSLDLFAGNTALVALNKMIDSAIDYYESNEYKKLVKEIPGKGHDVCEHGEDHDLVEFSLKYSGLNEKEKQYVRERLV